MTEDQFAELRELIAAIEHQQWWAWTLSFQEDVPHEVLERWRKNWKPYEELNDLEKDKDRTWADVVIAVLKPRLREWREKADLLEFLEELFEADFAKARKYLEKDNQWWEDHESLEAVKKLLPLVEELYGLCRHVHLGNHQCAGCQMYGLPKKLRAAVEGSQV